MSLDPTTFQEPACQSLDGISVEQWCRDTGCGLRALQTVGVWCHGITGQEPGEVSALFFLEMARGGLGIINLRHDGQHGGQFLRLKEGTQSIAQGMAKLLPTDSIKLDTPVVAISKTTTLPESLYTVRTAAGATFSARKVILSIPSPAYKEIAFTPALPHLKQLYTISTRYGCFVKFIALFRTPFWREKGGCGLAQSFCGPINHCRETCVDDEDNFAIACFMNGLPGRKWFALEPQQRVEAVLKQLGNLYGVPYEEVKSQFVGSITSQWMEDRWAGWGCPIAAPPPGTRGTGTDVESVHYKYEGFYSSEQSL